MLTCSFIISLHMHHKETSNNVRTSWQWSRSRQMFLLCRMIWQGEVRNLTLRYTSKSKNHSTSYAYKLIFLMLGLICCLNNCTMCCIGYDGDENWHYMRHIKSDVFNDDKLVISSRVVLLAHVYIITTYTSYIASW